MHAQAAENGGGQRVHDATAQLLEAALTPSASFTQAVRDFARNHMLDDEPLLRGESFELGGIPFTLTHHGARDPDGATVLIDFGQYAMDDAAMRIEIFRGLLAHNVRTPASLRGYFGLLPGSDQIRYCMRANLQTHTADRATNAIDELVGAVTEMFNAICASNRKQICNNEAGVVGERH